MRRTFWLRILILLAILFIAFGKKKGAGTLRRIFDVESFECLKHQSARTDKRAITTAAATTIGYK